MERKGRVTGVYTAGETSDLIILHKHIYMHCPQNATVQSAGGAPGTAVGPSPGPESTAVGPCRMPVVASRCQCSNICFTSLFPCLVFQDLPPQGVVNGCGRHAATKAFASAVWQSKPFFHFRCSPLCSNMLARHNVQ